MLSGIFTSLLHHWILTWLGLIVIGVVTHHFVKEHGKNTRVK